MPLTKPFSGESEENFISRCMGDPKMREEFSGLLLGFRVTIGIYLVAFILYLMV